MSVPANLHKQQSEKKHIFLHLPTSGSCLYLLSKSRLSMTATVV